ncbi:MAG TPA: single-stranded-DNA-specific exonuclease RecJ [Patescibacteria group bacterium]|nr:single-stranded-DNA-specific exonuclease RecJ [Patescibacteria group bacterium]
MKKRWVVKEKPNEIPNLPEYEGLVLGLLAARGLTTKEQIEDFLNPDYNKLHDPFLFADMQKICARIFDAIKNQEKIVIYSDYDADAITALAVMYLALKKLGANLDYYIPDRFAEGYGMNVEAVKKLCEDGAKIIITVDCGINAVEETNIAQSLGTDVIITDHHELTDELPKAFAIINPKNPNDNYPFRFLTGVGVAFKVVQALFRGEILSGWEKWLLDLVAIGTVADLQPLTGENRILVSFGLKVLHKTKWAGLRTLIKLAGVDSKIPDTYTLGFIIAPRINAAGRIKHADVAFKLLVCEDEAEAQTLAEELNQLNTHRQQLTEQVLSEARSQVELIENKKVLLAAGADWPKGVVGLVAGKLVEEYGRPVLVMDRGELVATGSARSVRNFDIVAALTHAKDLLTKYGGHTQAAGFTLVTENIPALHQKLLEYAETLDEETLSPVLEADAELAPLDLNMENYDLISKFAPFGYGNHKPKFLISSVEVLEIRLVGKESRHLKLRLRAAEKVLDAIGFNLGFWAGSLEPGGKVDLMFELDCNEWNNQKNLELKILDLRKNNLKL